jgi:WD40 repeat protein
MPGRKKATFSMPATFKTLDRAWQFASDNQSILAVDWLGRVARWQGAEFGEAQSLLELGASIREGRISEDGRLVAAGQADGTIEVWDLTNHKVLGQFKLSSRQARPLQFVDKGQRLVVHDRNRNEMQEWDLVSERRVRSWGMGAYLRTAGFSQDGRWFFGASYETGVTLSDMRSDPVSQRTLDFKEPVDAAISPDGNWIAAVSALGDARLWETETLRELALGGFMAGAGHGVVFSPDGKRLVTGAEGEDGGLKLWDVESHEGLITLPESARLQLPRSMSGWQIAFSPDGNILCSMNPWSILDLWRAPSWEEIKAAETRRADTR